VPVLPHFQVKVHGHSSCPCVILARHFNGCDYHTHRQGYGVSFVISLGILSWGFGRKWEKLYFFVCISDSKFTDCKNMRRICKVSVVPFCFMLSS
jgi:hypothetical protein